MVKCIWEKLVASKTVAPQFVSHHFSRLTTMRFEWTLEETRRYLSAFTRPQKHINHFATLFDHTQQILLLAAMDNLECSSVCWAAA